MSIAVSGAAIAAAVGYTAAVIARDKRAAHERNQRNEQDRRDRIRKAHARRMRAQTEFKTTEPVR